ncbi:5-formyltetrahydrofolate cyclo-ligase [Labrys miyagiensis]|uniref:5-formyltetrahydrofolate cyclo-ligase n=1 Tax=Labrys miyagiensis TaxID=346912 RepID=A0ABQ6CB91_9HYPH|nr:5-formyltetrahydrofolate cyclo-ligase [Labrys miyagiensis]GLS17651.1 5-formyltetrahydrofolate cyclo-ligase [Labrys miyagiensis]
MGDPQDDDARDLASPACFLHELSPGEGGMGDLSPAERRSNIFRWRRAERERLLALRIAIPADRRAADAECIAAHLDTLLPAVEGKVVSLYWPMRCEPDLRAWFAAILGRGAIGALPVVAEKNTPLVFHLWRPGEKLKRGFWNIPVPEKEEAVTPDIALAPIVGFDAEGYRLGYGGGYFDRTLAVLPASRRVIGVGYSMLRIRTIYPLPHDIKMDAIVTEAGSADVPS